MCIISFKNLGSNVVLIKSELEIRSFLQYEMIYKTACLTKKQEFLKLLLFLFAHYTLFFIK